MTVRFPASTITASLGQASRGPTSVMRPFSTATAWPSARVPLAGSSTDAFCRIVTVMEACLSLLHGVRDKPAAEEAHVRAEQLLDDLRLPGHVGDAGQEQYLVPPAGRQQRPRQQQRVPRVNVVVGQPVHE